jgi:hypothetical protein
VDYDENIQNNAPDDNKAYDDNENKDPEDKNIHNKYNQINEDDLINDEREPANPKQHQEDEGQGSTEG